MSTHRLNRKRYSRRSVHFFTSQHDWYLRIPICGTTAGLLEKHYKYQSDNGKLDSKI